MRVSESIEGVREGRRREKGKEREAVYVYIMQELSNNLHI